MLGRKVVATASAITVPTPTALKPGETRTADLPSLGELETARQRDLRQSRMTAMLKCARQVENVLIVGAIGSGRTSGSGRALALSYLSAGFGFLVLAAKPGEPALWREYCKLTGRLADLIEYGPQHPWRFDPLAFELIRGGGGGGLTENLVQMFSVLLDLAENNGGGGGGKEGE